MAYSAKVMEHFSNPHNVGEIKDADGVGEVGNPKCGDIMRMYICLLYTSRVRTLGTFVILSQSEKFWNNKL